MFKIVVFIFLLLLLLFKDGFSQDSIHAKLNLIKIEKQDSLSSDIFKLICNYRLIMLGESHGTNEPARLLVSLAHLLAQHNDSVQVGLEISSEQMEKYLSQPTESNIYGSGFFVNRTNDIRASFAWADIIAKLLPNHMVDVFFYDINANESRAMGDRDSLMYLKIKSRILTHPNWMTITLSGNIHNMLIPYNGRPKMAFYLSMDKDLDISNKLLSLNHAYAKGSMLNKIGNQLQLVQADNSNSIFAKMVDYDSYLYLYPKDQPMPYTGVYFTRKVTPAKMVNAK